MGSIIHEGDNRSPDERLAAFKDSLTDTLSSLDPQSRVTVLDVAREVAGIMEAGMGRGDLETVVDDALNTVEAEEFQAGLERLKLEATTGG